MNEKQLPAKRPDEPDPPQQTSSASSARFNRLVRPPDPAEHPAVQLAETGLRGWTSPERVALKGPADAAAVLRQLIGSADREHFVALLLNARHELTHVHQVSVGHLNGTSVHPREVFKAAVLANAACIVVGHNHPSGDVTPSDQDDAVSRRLREAGELIGIEVLDAMVVGQSEWFYSDSTKGLMRHEGIPRASETGTERRQHIALEDACRGLLRDLEDVLRKQGKEWWDETVLSGTTNLEQARRLLSRPTYDYTPTRPNEPA